MLDFYGTVVHEDDELLTAICEEISGASASGASPAEVSDLWSSTFFEGCAEANGQRFLPQREVERRSLGRVLAAVDAPLDAAELSGRLFQRWRTPPLFADAARFLAATRVPIVVTSNIDRGDVLAAIEWNGLPLEHVLTSEDVGSYKPRPELFERAIDDYDLDRSTVLVVGDSIRSDIGAARALDLDAVWVDRRRRATPDIASIVATVAGLDQLLSLGLVAGGGSGTTT